MSVLVRLDADICKQLSTLSSCLAGQVNNNNNTLSNELEREKKIQAGAELCQAQDKLRISSR